MNVEKNCLKTLDLSTSTHPGDVFFVGFGVAIADNGFYRTVLDRLRFGAPLLYSAPVADGRASFYPLQKFMVEEL
jgi:hypothetical protein